MNLTFKLLAGALLCAGSAVLSAHHEGDPAASPLAGAVMNAHLLADGQVSLGYNVNVVLYPGLSSAELESKVRAQPGLGKIQTPEQTSAQSLDLGIGAFGWLQMNVSLGSARIQRLREGHMHADGSYGSHEFGSPAGLSNTEVRAKALLAHGEGWKGALILGASLPTGEDNALSDGVSVDATGSTVTGNVKASPKFSYLSPAFQPGGGAVRGTVGAAYSREWGLWTMDGSLMAVVPAAYRGFKPGSSGSLGLSVGRLYGEEEGHENGFYGLEFSATQAEPSNLDGRSADDGGLVVAAGPRLRMPLGSRALAGLGAGFLLLKPSTMDPAPTASLSASLQALF
jgi:hypothetical protein